MQVVLSFGSATEKPFQRLFSTGRCQRVLRWHASCNGWRVEFTFKPRVFFGKADSKASFIGQLKCISRHNMTPNMMPLKVGNGPELN